jgi:hypothetical protein
MSVSRQQLPLEARAARSEMLHPPPPDPASMARPPPAFLHRVHGSVHLRVEAEADVSDLPGATHGVPAFESRVHDFAKLLALGRVPPQGTHSRSFCSFLGRFFSIDRRVVRISYSTTPKHQTSLLVVRWPVRAKVPMAWLQNGNGCYKV